MGWPASRSQVETDEELALHRKATDVDASLGGVTRQEFGKEADINYILSRFGVGNANYQPSVYGEVDYDLDLQQGLHALDDAQKTFNKLPKELQAKYGSPYAMLQAMAAGSFPADYEAVTPKPPATDVPEKPV